MSEFCIRLKMLCFPARRRYYERLRADGCSHYLAAVMANLRESVG